MRLYTFYDKRFNKLKERFSKTIKDNYEIIYTESPDFKSKGIPMGGKNVWLWRQQYLIDVIRANWGKVIVASDIDIQFFGPTEKIVEDAIKENDIVFQRCYYGQDIRPLDINIGFMAIRCNESSLRLFSKCLEKIKMTGEPEEMIINKILEKNKLNLKFGYFPMSIWAYPGMGKRLLWILKTPPMITLHHAIYATVEDQKIKQMNLIRFFARNRFYFFFYRIIFFTKVCIEYPLQKTRSIYILVKNIFS